MTADRGTEITEFVSNKKLDDIEDKIDTIDTVVDAILAAGVGGASDANRVFGIFNTGVPPSSEPLGDAYFVDADIGASGAGATWATAVKTIDESPALCTADQNDCVFVAPGAYDEDANAGGVLCDVAGIHIIGLGMYQITVVNSGGAATAVFTVSADHIEICGFSITENVNTVEGIYSTADYCWFHDIVLRNGMENGIHLDGCLYTLIEGNWFQSMFNDAIELSGVSAYNTIRRNYVFNAQDTGIHLNGNAADFNDIYENRVNGGGGTTDVGIAVALGDENSIVDNYILGCTKARTDTGSNNVWKNYYESAKTTSSLVYAVAVIDATTANADTKIIGIDNATYPAFDISEVYIDISDWNGKYAAGKILTVEMKVDVQGAAAPKSLKTKTYTQGADTEEVLVVDDIKAGEDIDIYVYSSDETGGDFEIYYSYVLTEVD